MGMSFCQVERTKHIGHERLDITLGNQKWHGGIPSFSKIPVEMIKVDQSMGRDLASVIIEEEAPKRIIPEPRAWAKKYFTAPSVS